MMWKLFKVYLRTVTITEGLAGDFPLRVKQFFKQKGKKFFFLSLQLIFCFFLICDFTGFTTPPPSVGAAPSMRACAKLYSALYLNTKRFSRYRSCLQTSSKGISSLPVFIATVTFKGQLELSDTKKIDKNCCRFSGKISWLK